MPTPSDPAPDPTAAATGLELAVSRTFLYRILAQAYESPALEGWRWLCHSEIQSACWAAIRATETTEVDELERCGEAMLAGFNPDLFGAFHDAYLAAFGHAARGRCPINEIEYGAPQADPLFQPHRLADLAAFYRAFGLELSSDASERHDHLCLELEFMSVLAAKEAYALEHHAGPEPLAVCREAQRAFLREHLGRWVPSFARRLAQSTDAAALAPLAEFTRAFVESDCRRLAVTPCAEELALRAVDEAAETLCTSCGISKLPPGALTAD